jgi:aryl-alcohol dehydrogenase-like predicted oxidoreductase
VGAKRPLGRTGLSIAPLVFGGNVLGWTADERTSFALLDAFVDAGFNMVDTADVYSAWVPGHVGGESETVLGHWLEESGRRDELLIATKVGMRTASGARGLSAPHIRESIAGSLRRLETDHVDLYQAHEDDAETPLLETLETFDGLVEDGEAVAFGASNYSAARLEEAAGVARDAGLRPFATLQPRYNLYDRDPYESDLAETCRRLGLGVITYSSLASGFLTGKYRSGQPPAASPRAPRAMERLTERGNRILGALDQVSHERATTPAAVAIAWLLSRPTVTAPIASATSVPQLDELIAGTRLALSREELDRLDAASA